MALDLQVSHNDPDHSSAYSLHSNDVSVASGDDREHVEVRVRKPHLIRNYTPTAKAHYHAANGGIFLTNKNVDEGAPDLEDPSTARKAAPELVGAEKDQKGGQKEVEKSENGETMELLAQPEQE